MEYWMLYSPGEAKWYEGRALECAHLIWCCGYDAVDPYVIDEMHFCNECHFALTGWYLYHV